MHISRNEVKMHTRTHCRLLEWHVGRYNENKNEIKIKIAQSDVVIEI